MGVENDVLVTRALRRAGRAIAEDTLRGHVSRDVTRARHRCERTRPRETRERELLDGRVRRPAGGGHDAADIGHPGR